MPFTPGSESRIADSVRYTEHQRRNLPTRPRPVRSPEGGLRRFELTENLTYAGARNATAYLLQWTGAAYVAQADTSFEVYDLWKKFIQNCKPTGQDGARGYAQWCWDRRIWEIVQMEHQARWIRFQAGNNFDWTDPTVPIVGLLYRDGYEPDTHPTTVWNTTWTGFANQIGLAMYDPANNRYAIAGVGDGGL